MSLKKAIKEAINKHSPKYIATRVWKIDVDSTYDDHHTMWIEVTVKKRKTKKLYKQ